MGKKTKKEKKKQFWTDFKGFISKGNVVDLAVALVVGSAFNKIVSQLVDSFINPLISIFIGGFNLNDWKYVYKPAEYNDAGELLKAEVAFTSLEPLPEAVFFFFSFSAIGFKISFLWNFIAESQKSIQS